MESRVLNPRITSPLTPNLGASLMALQEQAPFGTWQQTDTQNDIVSVLHPFSAVPEGPRS